MRRLFAITAVVALGLCISGCETLDTMARVGTSVAVATGAMTQEQADSTVKVVSAVGKTWDTLTPQNEYYIGRAVAANILKTYKPDNNERLNKYINLIGQSLVACADVPPTYGGYHFQVMQTDEVNAFAAPGGLILVSRGLIRCCKNEDELAAVLAHEITHVQLKHGLQAIEKSRLVDAAEVMVVEGAKNLGGKDLATLTKAFEGSVTDVTSKLVDSGYSRAFEYQADAGAVRVMKSAGYNPSALKSMLEEMGRRTTEGGPGFGKTHPTPARRLAEITGVATSSGPVSAPAARGARFDKAVAGL